MKLPTAAKASPLPRVGALGTWQVTLVSILTE